MYNESGGGALIGGGGAVSAGGLAYTGFSVVGFALLAVTLIFLGVLLVRVAMATRRHQVTAAVQPVDPTAALIAAVAATRKP